MSPNHLRRTQTSIVRPDVLNGRAFGWRPETPQSRQAQARALNRTARARMALGRTVVRGNRRTVRRPGRATGRGRVARARMAPGRTTVRRRAEQRVGAEWREPDWRWAEQRCVDRAEQWCGTAEQRCVGRAEQRVRAGGASQNGAGQSNGAPLGRTMVRDSRTTVRRPGRATGRDRVARARMAPGRATARRPGRTVVRDSRTTVRRPGRATGRGRVASSQNGAGQSNGASAGQNSGAGQQNNGASAGQSNGSGQSGVESEWRRAEQRRGGCTEQWCGTTEQRFLDRTAVSPGRRRIASAGSAAECGWDGRSGRWCRGNTAFRHTARRHSPCVCWLPELRERIYGWSQRGQSGS